MLQRSMQRRLGQERACHSGELAEGSGMKPVLSGHNQRCHPPRGTVCIRAGLSRRVRALALISC